MAGFGAGIGIQIRSKAGMGDLLAEVEGFFGEVGAFGGDVFFEVIHVEFVGPFLVVELFAAVAEFGARGEVSQALEGKKFMG